MPDNLLPVALVGGGIAYMLVKGENAAVPQPGDANYVSPWYGSTLADGLAGMPPGGGGFYNPFLDNMGQAGFNVGGRLADPDARQKLDLLNVATEKAYAAMSQAAKTTAADKVNKELQLDPPLRGTESWEQLARIIGGATGGAGCNAIPGIGTAISPVCAMAGAYLGVKLEAWMSSELGDLKGWVTQNLGEVIDTIQDKLSEWWNDLF